MEKVLIDTDVLIDFLRGYGERIQLFFEKIEKREIKGLVSQVTIIELYSGDLDEKKETSLEKLLAFFEIIDLTNDVCRLAGKLKKKYKMSLADSIISATASMNKLSLFTLNTKHFLPISELKLINR